ncbi:MAG TPA: hypothetical protein VFU43_24130 [Streptosporangiaceae bacterium]|nr:hypothetical protein [Streptosporangiaceae bacterium]
MSSQTVVPDEAESPRKERKIGLWGASGSGKTSFLAALYVAVTENTADWRIIGDNRASVDFLTEMTKSMTQHHVFPKKTEGIQKLSWTMVGQTERIVGRRFRKKKETVPLRFRLDLIDAQGRLLAGMDRADDLNLDFGETRAMKTPKTEADQLIEELAACDGLVYLFDPLRERSDRKLEDGDDFQHFQWALQNIAHICDKNGTFDTHLPHYLAVCITKLDDPLVFRTADELGYLTADTQDPYLFPRVVPGRTEELYLKLGSTSPTRSALKVHDSIRRYFHEDRVRYFATSSIGFYVPPGATRFRRANFRNVVPDSEKSTVIRGDIHPINVLEPLLWLGDVVSR